MKIGELSTRSGVPVGTIKFYIREGLLPRGRRSKANQARYGVHHLERIRLIQALTDVAKVSIGAAREIVRALQDPNPKPGKVFRRAFDSLAEADDRAAATGEAQELEEVGYDWIDNPTVGGAPGGGAITGAGSTSSFTLTTRSVSV